MDKGTITRIIVFALAWINTFLAQYGYELPHISEEFISIVVTAVVTVWVGWKDNDIRKKTIERKNKIKEMENHE